MKVQISKLEVTVPDVIHAAFSPYYAWTSGSEANNYLFRYDDSEGSIQLRLTVGIDKVAHLHVESSLRQNRWDQLSRTTPLAVPSFVQLVERLEAGLIKHSLAHSVTLHVRLQSLV